MKLTEEQEKRVEEIAYGEWWKASAKEIYEDFVVPLMEKGFSFEEACEFLQYFYSIVANEYGS